ncbi:MAG TPA: FAD-linked oxidase C-terminal domain-containing protein [Longimicrobiales bacterium]|nr:FAD-linked oxidase C-terminal domain-containing protein [Longimicrobiales bacterium]
MDILSPDLARRLRDIVGDGAVVSDPERLLVYETDALGRFHQTPLAVVLPSDTAEAAAVVEAVHEAGLAIVPRGAGTGLSGGAVAAPGSVMLGTARMNRILSFDPDRRRARVQAGVRNSQLAALVRPHGLVYAPDPSSQAACTLGGNVAENSGGPHCLKYGVTRRYVQGLTLIDGAGRIVELGGANRPRGDAPDLLGPIIGSEGCFGLVTEIELGLVPETEGVRTLLGLFETTAEAGEAVTAIISDGLLPAALEIVDRHTISAVEASPFRAGYPTGVGAALVVEFDGNEFELDADADRAEAHCLRAGATEVRRATDDAERLRLWQGRKKAFGTMGRLAPDLMVQDATVPRSVLPEVLRGIDQIAARHELRIANVFHAGDGNLHPNILYDRRDAEVTERVEKAAGEIMKLCVDAGGTITGEHGVGMDKRDYVRLIAGPAERQAMAAVRDAFDPELRWNPGKVLPDEEPVATGSGDMGAPAGASTSGFTPPPSVTGIEVNPPDLSVRAPGDVPWGDVQSAMAADGQWSPIAAARPDLSTAEALHRGLGPLEAMWGPIRESVLGATVIPPDGGRLHLGGRVVKNVAGFDLLGLFVGEGALGRVEEVTLRAYPMPEVMEVLRWLPCDDRSALPGWPHPQVVTADGHAVLLCGTVAWVRHERARLVDLRGTPARHDTGVDALRAFVAAFELDEPFGRAQVERDGAPTVADESGILADVRPGADGDEGGRFAEVVASMRGARWAWDPTLRRGRLSTRPAATGAAPSTPSDSEAGHGTSAPERWSELAEAMAREGGGVAILRGPEGVRRAVRRATHSVDSSASATEAIARRVVAVFGDTLGPTTTSDGEDGP